MSKLEKVYDFKITFINDKIVQIAQTKQPWAAESLSKRKRIMIIKCKCI